MTEDTKPPRLPLDADAGFPEMPAAEFVALREQIGTQNEVALELQTARRTLGRWERGERAVPGIAAVAIRLLAEKAEARRDNTLRAAQAMGAKVA